jgi:hypothetical protein
MREGVFVFSSFAVTQIVGTELHFMHSFRVLLFADLYLFFGTYSSYLN